MAGCNPDIAFDAFIFDLDGTLLDTADDLGGALNRVLADANIAPVDKSIYRPAASNGANALLEVGFGDKWPDVEQLALRQQLLDYYAEDIAIHSKCFNGIEQLLASLEQNSIKWGIMTNKPGFLTEPLVQAIPSLANVMAVVSGDTLAVAKPSPEPLIHTANMLDVDPTRCLYIGDAERDIQAAKAANMYSATALWGYIPSVDTALSWGADFNWQTPTDGFIHI
jgi:phosphoglycolate phosphatase